MKTQEFTLLLVETMPQVFEEGILYFSKSFSTAIHLCACGCKSITVTPINERKWQFSISDGKPTLSPSIGNFNIPCKSHYYIKDGKTLEC